MAQEKITFYKRWSETTKDLPNDARLELYDAIVQYAFEGTIMDFKTPLAKVSFGFIKQDIDTDNKRMAEISAKRKSAGSKGGAPKNNRNALRNKETAEPIQAPTLQENLFSDAEQGKLEEKPKKSTKPTKHRYAELVLLTEAEYQKLVEKWGEDGAQWMVTQLDNYKAARGMTYKSDYRAILNWVVEKYEKQMNYGSTEINRRHYATPSAKEQRDAEFADHIAKKFQSD